MRGKAAKVGEHRGAGRTSVLSGLAPLFRIIGPTPAKLPVQTHLAINTDCTQNPPSPLTLDPGLAQSIAEIGRVVPLDPAFYRSSPSNRRRAWKTQCCESLCAWL